jgi:hypothetical protein
MKEQRTEGGRVHNEKHWLTPIGKRLQMEPFFLHKVFHFKKAESIFRI